jgi:methionyl-tRNA formyltransferase
MVTALAELGSLAEIAQPDAGITYAAKIDKAEARLDFSLPAEQVRRVIRAFAPSPGAYFEYGGERIRLLAASVVSDGGQAGEVIDEALTIACGTGAIRPQRAQRAGKAAMTVGELLRGFRIPAGTRL